MYAPNEGIANPSVKTIVQFLTLTASLIVTTIITLVYTEISTK